jgi:antitoxin component YwqK of YwqJK toxin-antitoxin module
MKYIGVLILLLACLGAKAQVTKTFFDKKNRVITDSTKANSYTIQEKMADTGWYVKEYQQGGFILSEGLYKDEKMKIPQGKFIYYWIGVKDDASSNQYFSYKQYVGYYENGSKTGTWLTYDQRGNRTEVLNYVNGKLNGLCQQYTYPGYLYVDGTYKDGKRVGDWHVYDKNGRVTITDTYDNGKIINTIRSGPDSSQFLGNGTMVSNIKTVQMTNGTLALNGVTSVDNKSGQVQDATPQKDFKSLLQKRISSIIGSGMEGKLLIQFIVDKNGAINSASIFKATGNSPGVEIANLIPGICEWRPALTLAQPVSQAIYCSVIIENSAITITYSPNLNQVLGN